MLQNYKAEKRKIDKDTRKSEIKRMKELLAAQQMQLKEAGLPVIILIEGWAAAGKGTLINELISEMDPRFFNVCSTHPVDEAEERYPFLHKYFKAIPPNGKLLFMDSGWMEETVTHRVRREIPVSEYRRRVDAVNVFERQLRDNGYVIIKLFLHISEKDQRERLAALRENSDTDWRVTDRDLWQNAQYNRFLKDYDEFMENTDKLLPWKVLNSADRKDALLDALNAITGTIAVALEKGRYYGSPAAAEFETKKMPKLKDIDLSVSLTDEEYKKELKRLQKKLSELHNRVYRKRIPVVICYEGWDAAGKGGNIRRLTYPLDPRGFDVHPIASPTPDELARHYLWRFWTRLPKSGHFAIFDRTWYGRVMVERLEGFCTEKDWKRAYGEMNEFERELSDWGAVVLKFWVQIDPDTQLERFTDRQNTPEKQWKITEEDWRNREKWPQYEEAIEEMLRKTNTPWAPWHIIESVDKKYARIKVLRIVTEALEKALEENIVRGMKKDVNDD